VFERCTHRRGAAAFAAVLKSPKIGSFVPALVPPL
jgi:hypothetical protein